MKAKKIHSERNTRILNKNRNAVYSCTMLPQLDLTLDSALDPERFICKNRPAGLQVIFS